MISKTVKIICSAVVGGIGISMAVCFPLYLPFITGGWLSFAVGGICGVCIRLIWKGE